MDQILSLLTPGLWVAALLVAVGAGVIKGLVGFAMPTVLISGLSSFIAPELALAGLILPTLVTNGLQALRQGWRNAWASVVRFRVFLIAMLIALPVFAQFVRFVSPQTLLLMIGVPVAVFAALQLAGIALTVKRPSRRIEATVGVVAGAIGGISGVWGPPTVAYLTALNTEKREQVRVQGVIYGIGAVALTGAHVGSGVLRAETLPLSVALVLPAVAGMWLGTRIQDRIDQATFRKATLAVLLIAGLNLVRRGLLG